jgi:hypothetical protein
MLHINAPNSFLAFVFLHFLPSSPSPLLFLLQLFLSFLLLPLPLLSSSSPPSFILLLFFCFLFSFFHLFLLFWFFG